ncbi:MAG: ABC transporter ATP-binding protein [Spirochaetaceae bacterium]|nr:MAG: ABC transporter ATP-binding protein [Spirochaetaceae bacterium]
MATAHQDTLLEVTDLCKHYVLTRGVFKRAVGIVKAVDGVSFSVKRGEILALVGESGCGKTTTGRCVMRAVEPTSGSIRFRIDEEMVEMTDLSTGELREAWKAMGMVFQDPYSSLNPRMNILETVGEPFHDHGLVTNRREMEDRVAELLREVRLDPSYMMRYPHAFSGGQRQRIAIARALALRPKLVVADEAVSALDVSVQAQLLQLLKDLRDRFDLTYLFVAHNLAVIEYMSDRIAVMYVGKIVEMGNTADVYARPRHPYTEALMAAIPKLNPKARIEKREKLLKGEVADPANPPSGCYFHPRCAYAQDICTAQAPPLVNMAAEGESEHLAACHFASELTLSGVPEGERREPYAIQHDASKT